MSEKKRKPKDTPIPVEELKEQLAAKKAVSGPDYSRGLSTGSTLLNLAYTGRPDVGYIPGYYYYFVGDSNSGKSFCTLVAMAEASINSTYDDYRFVVDNVEEGIQMDLEKFFGRSMAQRLEPPRTVNGEARHSRTVEEFYFNLDDALKKGPCIYVLDSMDGLSSASEANYSKKLKTYVRRQEKKGGEGDDKAPGSYGDGKAKVNSAMLRQVIGPLSQSGSILIVISQTRDNIQQFSFEAQTHAGGNALEFYAQVQTWTSIKKKLKKKVHDKDRHIGNSCQFHVRRSRFTGRENKVDVPIYFSHGVDDVGACIDYLIEEGHWKKSGSTLSAPEFDHKGTREELIRLIEKGGGEKKLQGIVTDVWLDIEQQMAVERKKKYR